MQCHRLTGPCFVSSTYFQMFFLQKTFRKRRRLRSQRARHFAGRHADRTSRLQTKPPSSGQTDAGLSLFGRSETYQLSEQPEVVHTSITDIQKTIYSLLSGLTYHLEFEQDTDTGAKQASCWNDRRCTLDFRNIVMICLMTVQHVQHSVYSYAT